MQRDPIERLDDWLRGEFIRINSSLEEFYFAGRTDVIAGPEVDALKLELLRQGGPLMDDLAGLAALPDDWRASYRLLGLVGHYLAACQRHEAFAAAEGSGATGPTNLEGGRQAAWDVSMRIGAALNVVPRFVFAHQSLFNEAVDGRFRTFTTLADEEIFIRYNALGVVAYERAAAALRGLADIGVTSEVAAYKCDDAEQALADVLRFNQALANQLNVERFFFNIRPYFKTYRVGDRDYRGANAGDFSAINEIDVRLGLCSMADPFYRALVREKIGHVPPDDRPTLESLDREPSLLDHFVRELGTHGATAGWKANAAKFLSVCKVHGAAYAHHHHRLVKAYVESPSKTMTSSHSAGVTSSGPPLEDVMAMLQRLADMRAGRSEPKLTRLHDALAS